MAGHEKEGGDIPAGVVEYLHAKEVPKGRAFASYLYRMRKPPGETRPKAFFVEKLENDFFEHEFGEEYIKEKHGGGEYQTMIKWKSEPGEKSGLISEKICIEGPAKSPPGQAAPAPASLPKSVPDSSGSKTPDMMEKILKALPVITAFVSAIKEIIPKPDFSIFEKLQEGQLKSLDRVSAAIAKMKIDIVKGQLDDLNVLKTLSESEDEMSQAGQQETTPGETIWPEWLKPFAPYIEKYAAQLLSDSPIANFMRDAVLKSDVFQENWGDEEKRGEFIESLTNFFGEDMTANLIQKFNDCLQG